MTNLKKEIKDVTDALGVIWSSPIGKNVLYDLRNHSEPSKESVKMNKETNKRINTLMLAFFILFIGGIGANWVVFEKSFAGHEANLSTKIEIAIEKSSENAREIEEIKDVLSNLKSK